MLLAVCVSEFYYMTVLCRNIITMSYVLMFMWNKVDLSLSLSITHHRLPSTLWRGLMATWVGLLLS